MIVTKSTGSWYTVFDMGSGEEFRCRLRGALRLEGRRSTNPVVVGDEVVVEKTAESDYLITSILPRKNYLIRRSTNLSRESHIIAANIDYIYIIVSAEQPRTNPEFIDRVLVTCEAYNIPATIVVNKSDIDSGEEFREIYELAGYEVINTSVKTGEGIEELSSRLRGGLSLLTGNSGVGKSSVINAIDPSIGARVGNISHYHRKGMHTTTFSEIFRLSNGGFIIDTPGIKGFGLVDLDNDELARYFPDLSRYAPECGYYNCTHIHEPDCAVMQAFAEGKISESRYESYLKMLDDDGKHRK